MFPLTNAVHVVDALTHTKTEPCSLNADYAWHLSQAAASAPVEPRDAWPLRLLPAFLRTRIRARLAAREYERKLISMWELSPHLLKDIGVMVGPDETLTDHLVAAPPRVIEHVVAAQAAAEGLPKQAPVAAPGPAAAAPVPKRAPAMRHAGQGIVPV